MIIKRCIYCYKWFRSTVLSYQPYCPICRKKHWKDRIDRIKSRRSILAAWMDIYDTRYPIITKSGESLYERVCRVCGDRLIRKRDGKHSYHMRYCHKHGYKDFNQSWNFMRWEFLKEFKEKHRTSITLTAMDDDIEKIFRKYWDSDKLELRYYLCEECRKLLSYYQVEVHHEIPVHTLTEDNLHLIWEMSNFRLYCHDCHRQIDHQLKRTEEEKQAIIDEKYKGYRKITDFFKCKSGVEKKNG